MAKQSQRDELPISLTEPDGSARKATAPLLNKTLLPRENCVICLDQISDKATALPCRHGQFDFSCLGTWLQRQQVCPLCKAEVRAVRFQVDSKAEQRTQLFCLPPPEEPKASRAGNGVATNPARQRRLIQRRLYIGNGRGRARRYAPQETSKDTALDFRRRVYRNRMYSLHVGSNRISRYRNLTPASFSKDERLVTRARMFTRRELQVFDFLNPSLSSAASSSRSSDRRANNADFLLEYIIGILKSIDLKGSTGQAEELLKDFLGRDNAKLFLHELEAWLRSPYENLKDWDRAVQYALPAEQEGQGTSSTDTQSRTSACQRTDGMQSHISTPGVPEWFADSFVLQSHEDRRRPS